MSKHPAIASHLSCNVCKRTYAVAQAVQAHGLLAGRLLRPPGCLLTGPAGRPDPRADRAGRCRPMLRYNQISQVRPARVSRQPGRRPMADSSAGLGWPCTGQPDGLLIAAERLHTCRGQHSGHWSAAWPADEDHSMLSIVMLLLASWHSSRTCNAGHECIQ